MSKKIIDKEQLGMLLSDYAKVNPEVAKVFIESLSMVIIQALQDNDEVRISGLGLFKTIITQQGGKRVAFTPDEKFRTHINAPFSCFEPVVIGMVDKQENQSFVPMEKKLSITDSSLQDSTSLIETDYDENNNEDKEQSDNENADFRNANLVDVSDEDLLSDSEETSTFSESNTNISNLESNNSHELSEEIREEALPPTEVIKTIVVLERNKRKKYAWIGLAFIFVVGIVYVFMNRVVEMNPNVSQEGQSHASSHQNTAILSSNSSIESETTNSLRTALGDTVSQAIISDTINQSPIIQPATTSDDDGMNDDLYAKSNSSLTKEKIEVKISDKMIKRDGDGKRVYVQLEEGERLTLIALREYGDKAFWGYIFDVNRDQLKSPSHVTVGVKLYLPDEHYWQIDSTDENSLKKARQHCANILKEFD